MIGLIALSLARNRARTALTATGIAIGVATIVALLSLTQGLRESVAGLVHLGGADFGLFQSGVADPTASVLPDSLAVKVADQPGVAAVAPIQVITGVVPAAPEAIVFGAAPDTFVARRLVVTEGRRNRGSEAMVGDLLADRLDIGVGDTLTLAGRPVRVAGVYHGGVSFEDDGVLLSPVAAGELAGRHRVTTIAVTVGPREDAASVAREIVDSFPGTMTISNPEEVARSSPSLEIVTKSVTVIALLALVIGAITVTNTMAMAVLERERELALLAAIGWSHRQVATLIVGEGLGVGLLGAGLGLVVGVAASHLMVSLLSASDFVSPVVTAWGLGRGLLVGLAIGVLGGIYPAWRVIRLPPAALLGRF